MKWNNLFLPTVSVIRIFQRISARNAKDLFRVTEGTLRICRSDCIREYFRQNNEQRSAMKYFPGGANVRIAHLNLSNKGMFYP